MNTASFPSKHRFMRCVQALLFLAIALGDYLAVHAAERREVGALARNQIESLIAEKAARTPAQRKIDSQLIYALRQKRQQRIAQGVDQLQPRLRSRADGRVLVDLRATVEPTLLAAIATGGGTVINSHPRFGAVRALVPIELVEQLAARPGVRNIRPADEATTNVGAITSAGDITHRAKEARDTILVDGSGVRIGVLSDSVDFLANSQANGELPPVTVLPGRAGSGSGEGTAMLEIIHDIAPGSDLYFSTAFQGVAAFAQSILDLHAAGCRIIVDDITYFSESPFQDGPIARAVKEVSDAGTLYFSSAGNSGNLNDGTSSTWEGDFADGGAATIGRGGRLHDFGGSTLNEVRFGSSPRVDLFWADPLGQSANDYDVYLVTGNGTVVAASSNTQDGDDDPYESIPFASPGTSIVIVKFSGEGRYLHLSGGRSPLEFTTSGATRGHNASGASNAFCVAATWVRSPAVPFVEGTVNPVETFSSDGPRRMFFEGDGTPITPGNFSASGGLLLQKPDLTAADGVATSVPGFNPFFGTSAAAPHAAAIAALLLSHNPLMTPPEIRLAMESTALDIEALGRDQDSGAGIVMALAALQAPATPVPRLVFDAALLAGGNGNSTVDLDECGDVFVTLLNLNCPCGEAATNVMVRLESVTPGVLVDPTPIPFPDVPASGRSTNEIPFRISTTFNYSCASPARFILHVTSGNAGQVNLNFQLASSPPEIGSPVTFVSTDVPKPIPDLGSVESTITVSNLTQQLDGVRVALYLTHTFDSDLAISLISPDGTTVELTSANGGSGDNYGTSCDQPTIFDDSAPISITAAGAPFAGSFQPEQPLRLFSGKAPSAANGTWRLRVRDLASDDTGVLQCWKLETTPISCPTDSGACLFAPFVLTSPSDTTVTNGGTLELGVTADGTGPLSYQWYFNKTNALEGATNTTLTLEGITFDQAGFYSVAISNLYGSATSAPAQVVVVSPPQIVTFPPDTLTTNGATVQFSASAAGTAPLAYQWIVNQTNLIAGATNSTLTLTNVTPALAGSYSVFVSNPYGTASSPEAILTVVVPPFIILQPQSLALIEGDNATFTAAAGGSEPLVYYWYYNETMLLTNSSEPVLTLTNITLADAGGYSLLVSNEYGTATTIEAELTVTHLNQRPSIALLQPLDNTHHALDAGPLLLEATASDQDGTIAQVEFFADGLLLRRSPVAPYRFEWIDPHPGVSAIYAIATDDDGARSTSTVSVVTIDLAEGATSIIPVGSIWNYFDLGSDLATDWIGRDYDASSWPNGPAQLGYGDGDENTVVSFGPVDTEKFITTYFRRTFVLTDPASFTNLVVRLLRDDGAIVYLNGHEVVRSNLPEGPVTFTTVALEAIGGADEQTFVTNDINPELLVSGTNIVAVELHQSSPQSSDLSFDLELLGQRSFAPRFLVQPGSRTAPEGTSVEFFADAIGASPLGFQWTFNGTNVIAGATNSVLALTSVTPADSGDYSVTVSNEFGVAVSTNAVLTVVRSNRVPAIALVSPADGAAFDFNGGIILLLADAADADGSIDRVEFFADGSLLGESGTAPYAFNWIDARAGEHDLTAVAYDNDGGSATSAVVHVVVNLSTNLIQLAVTGTEWKYLDTGTDLQTSWRSLDFDDSTWSSGPSPLGYGDGSEATTVSFGPTATDKYPTTYFRRSFLLTDAASFTIPVLRLQRDDGAVVYLNDVEVFRSNMPDGEISFATFASSTVSGAAETNFVSSPLDSSLLRNGTNVLAVEIHQANATSSDLRFDLELLAERLLSPLILEQPASFSVTRGASVTFSVMATGAPPLAFQWYLDETNEIAGATEPTLTLANVDPSMSGSYRVVVSNFLGTTVSEAATLEVSATNFPPIVTLLDPANNTTNLANAGPIHIEASAVDPDGTVASVALFANGIPLAVLASPPYVATWLDAPVGTHQVWAVATDSLGVIATSAVAHITVLISTNTPVLVSTGAVWAYLDTGTDLGTSWREIDFDDSTWASGPAELGYGDTSAGRPEATVVSFGPAPNAKYPTTYFRKSFVLTDESSFRRPTIHLLRDDGAVVYLNGIEVFRSNMPEGPISYTTLASGAIPNADETTYFISTLETNLLRNGTNVIAVEIHQATVTSSDISFDLALTAERPVAPILLSQPASLAVTNGGSAAFSVVASGTPILTYQWYRNGTNLLAGETNTSLLIPLATVLQAGTYSVEVANDAGTIRSTEAQLIIDGGGNLAPIVDLLQPANFERFSEGAPILILATAIDLDGDISSVSFHANGTLLAEVLESPYEFAWTNPPVGLHAIWVTARDAEGTVTTSSIANVSVNSSSGQTLSLVSTGAVWRFLDDGSDAGTAWRTAEFDDSPWASGPAELGYGDDGAGRPEATVISFGENAQNKHITYYFRHTFVGPAPEAVQSLRFELLRDDGAAVYLNGQEVFRSNLPEGEIDYQTTASSTVSQNQETQFVTVDTDSSFLVDGTNVIAVEVHQVNRTSSDLSFDLSLIADEGSSPQINIGPQSLVATNSGIAEFHVDATGSGPLRYQWFFNTTNLLTGETNSTLTLSNVTPAFAGLYAVEVRNGVGATYSDAAALEVFVPPQNIPPDVALTSPLDGSTYPEQAAIPLAATATDSDGTVVTVDFMADDLHIGSVSAPPYLFDWIGAPIGKHTLRAVATDNLGATNISAAVEISVLESEPNLITKLTLIPTNSVWKYLDTGVDLGSEWNSPNFDDSLWPSGPAELGYGDDTEGSPENTVLSFGPDPDNKFPTYYFRKAFELTNAASVTELRLRVMRDDGVIVYLNGVEVFRDNLAEGPIAFTDLALVAVGGTDERTFLEATLPVEFLSEGTNVVSAEIHQANVTSSDISFDLELLATRPEAPFITSHPQDQNIPAGGTAQFVVAATGARPLTYQWYRNSLTAIPGATNDALVIVNAQIADEGSYSVVITNAGGLVRSQPAILRILTPPVIEMPPQGLTVVEGGIAEFRVVASGTGPLSYRWFYNTNAEIPGIDGDTLSIPFATLAEAGTYSVTVSNAAGVASSPAAGLRVLVPNQIVQVQKTTGGVTFAFTTETGLKYTVDFKDDLNGPTWNLLPGAVKLDGNGSLLTVEDPGPIPFTRFYRVRVE